MQASASFASRASSRLLRMGRAVIDGVLPPRCLGCGEIVSEPDGLCGRCWAGITFFAPPWCVLCGAPFAHPMDEDTLCADCARQRWTWDRARAVLRYDRNSRHLVLGLKHGDRTHVAGAFGRWMHRAGTDVLAGADLLVPVPLHWTRVSAPLQSGGSSRPSHPCRRRPSSCGGLGGSPPQDTITGPSRRGGPRTERPRRFRCSAQPRFGGQAGRDCRRCYDYGSNCRGMRSRAETGRGCVRGGIDAGTGAASGGIVPGGGQGLAFRGSPPT